MIGEIALHWVDVVVLVWVLGVLLWLGFRVGKLGGKDSTSFMVSGRSLPWWLLGTSMVATTFASDTPLAVTGFVSKYGISGNWFWWSFLFGATLTTYLFARLWRRAAVTTDLELVELRYGGAPGAVLRGVRSLYMSFLLTGIILGWVFKAMTTILTSSLGLDPGQSHWVLGALVVLALGYTLLSGLWGVVVTDIVQFVIAMAGSIALAVVAWSSIGGNEGLTAKLTLGFGAERTAEMMSFLPGDTLQVGWMVLFYYLGVQWWAVLYPGNEPGGGTYVAQRILAARSERDARAGTLLFTVLHYTLRTWPWIIVALWAAATYKLDPSASEGGYVRAMGDLLPPGLFGLMLASFFAAFMSTVDTQLHLSSTYLVNDFYRPFLVRDASERHYLWAGRVGLVLVLAVGTLVSMQLEDVGSAWKLFAALGAGSGLVLVLRWYWWRVNAFSELSAMFASLVIAFLVDPKVSGLFLTPEKLGLPLIAGDDLGSEVRRMLAIIGGTTVVWVITTMLTPAVPIERLQAFYAKVRPGGMWGPVRERMVHGEPIEDMRHNLLCWLLATVLVFSLLFGAGKLLFGELLTAGILLVFGGLAGAVLWGGEMSDDDTAPPAEPER